MRIISFILTLFFSNLILGCPLISMNGTDVSCYLGSDGSATATISGPNGPFTVTWSTGQVNNNVPSGASVSANFLPAGIYTVYVVDAIGCSSTNLISISEPPPVTGSTVVTNVLCKGDATGSIDLTPMGGTAPYGYTWSNTSTSEDLSSLLAGTYDVTITDANGCSSSTISSIITEPASAVTSSLSGTNISCFSGNDGSVDLTPSGGTQPYTFSWNGGLYTSEDLSNVISGTYNVVVTDANGCTSSNSIVLSEPTLLSSSVTGSDVLCNGGSDGSIDLTPSGGVQPYSYSWYSSSISYGNSEDLNGVSADTYSVTITDANGCVATNTVTINEPTALNLTYTFSNVSCYGASDGIIDVSVLGGTPGYSFSWSNSSGIVSTNEDLINVPAEIYTGIITDVNNCTITITQEITQPQSPLTLSSIVTDVLCYGDNTGAIDLTVLGGTSPYIVSWSNSQTTEDIANLVSGSYLATVVDANNCSETLFSTVNQPNAPLSNNSLITSVNCYGDSTGEINNTVSGGTAPYQFTWNNSQFSLSVTSEDLIAFPADEYNFIVTDANNCTFLDTLIISQPPKLEIELTKTDVLCYGDSSGNIYSSIQGGVLPYNINWSNSVITSNNLYIPSGMYSVVITDANNCVLEDSISIYQPIAPLSFYYFSEEPSCFGSSDGKIELTINGGTQPYVYNWSNGISVENNYNLTSGMYYFIVSDSNNCILSDSIFLDQPSAISIQSIITPVNCFNESNGSIDITVSGGSPGYSFQWANSSYVLSTLSEDLINYPAEEYFVEITDSLGCTASTSFSLPEPDKLVIELDPHDVSCYGYNNGAVYSFVQGGNFGAQLFNWSNGETTSDIENLPPGEYSLVVTDSKGCTDSASTFINQPDSIIINYEMFPVSCRDQHDGKILLSPQGGLGNYQYNWNELGETTSSVENLLGGEYTVSVTDIVGCSVDTIIEVTVLDIDCIEAPTAFTPEGDGYNDIWKIKNIELYPDAKIKVFNQWGRTVYESVGYDHPWDGTYYGNPLPNATYYYIINIGENVPDFTGPVTIVR